jgi:hypothetical protein
MLSFFDLYTRGRSQSSEVSGAVMKLFDFVDCHDLFSSALFLKIQRVNIIITDSQKKILLSLTPFKNEI